MREGSLDAPHGNPSWTDESLADGARLDEELRRVSTSATVAADVSISATVSRLFDPIDDSESVSWIR